MNEQRNENLSRIEQEHFTQLCDMVADDQTMQELRVRFAKRPGYAAIREYLRIATEHDLRCWLSSYCVVIQSRIRKAR